MSTRSPLQTEILKFVGGLPYWEQYLSAYTLGAFTDEKEPDVIKEALQLLLEDSKLTPLTATRPDLKFGEPTPGSGSPPPGQMIAGLRFKSLASVKHVNAIKQTKPLDFSANVTVVYGKNGAGKSGFIRLLNNAFYSRGDRLILPNIFEGGAGNPEGEFEFQKGTEAPYILKYPSESERAEFAQFAVFDSKSVHVHLNEKNELHIEPVEFDFFSKLATLVEKVEEHFDSLIEKRTKPNEFVKRFDGESNITTAVSGLGADSDLAPLRELAKLTDDDHQSLADAQKQLSELHADQLTRKKQELTNVKAKLASLQQELAVLGPVLDQSILEQFKTDLASLHSLKAQIAASGVQQFKDDRFLGIGSAQWLAFLKSAREFSQLQHGEHPRTGEPCPLCHQSLEQNAAALIRSYWTFLEGKLETDLRAVESRINAASAKWSSARVPSLPEDSQTALWLTSSKLPLDLSLKSYLTSASVDIQTLKENARTRTWTEVTALDAVGDTLFKVATTLLDQQIAELDAEAVKTKEQELKGAVTLLQHRKKLSELLVELETHVMDCSWLKLAAEVRKKVGTRDITNRRKDLYEEHLNGRYIVRFHQWCTELRTPYPIDIKQKGGSGKSERQLMVRGKYTPSQILSEGEQRAIALADFFTEVEIANIPSGLIFDDPVNSQDLDRKELIAKKIVEQARTKQVIVFTHDLSFVYDLRNEAERSGLVYGCHWIEKTGMEAGIVIPGGEPSLEKAFVEPTEALDYLERARREANPKERESILRVGFDRLRTTYEAFVIFDVLNGCLVRFDREFKPGRLKEAFVEKSYLDKACEKHGTLSGYVGAHLHSPYTSSTPSVDSLDAEIKEYISFRKDYRTKRNEYRKDLH